MKDSDELKVSELRPPALSCSLPSSAQKHRTHCSLDELENTNQHIEPNHKRLFVSARRNDKTQLLRKAHDGGEFPVTFHHSLNKREKFPIPSIIPSLPARECSRLEAINTQQCVNRTKEEVDSHWWMQWPPSGGGAASAQLLKLNHRFSSSVQYE